MSLYCVLTVHLPPWVQHRSPSYCIVGGSPCCHWLHHWNAHSDHCYCRCRSSTPPYIGTAKVRCNYKKTNDDDCAVSSLFTAALLQYFVVSRGSDRGWSRGCRRAPFICKDPS
jgi:hypothetical protein